MKRIFYLITACTWVLAANGQRLCQFTHYSSEDGLSQNTVMSILQDRKGNLWFSTWDGINRFDGYTFKVYKPMPGNGLSLGNNRIDHICEDRYGYLYLRAYDDQVYRFDPRTETSLHIVATAQPDSMPSTRSVHPLDGGAVWLLTRREGAVRVSTDPATGNPVPVWYRPRSASFPATHVYDVYEDSEGCEWLLTDNGLGRMQPGGESPAFHLTGTSGESGAGGQPFFTAEERDGEIFFGSADGQVYVYRRSDGTFRPLRLQTRSRIIAVRSLQDDDLLMATDTDGFFVHNLRSGTSVHYGAGLLPPAPVVSVYVDRCKEVWFEQHVPGTVAHFNPKTCRVRTEVFHVEATGTDRSNPAFHAHEDVHGTLWVHPYGGGFSYFDREAGCLRPFFNSLSGSDWRFSNKIHSAFSDRQGNLWLCTHSRGLEKVTFPPARFHRMASTTYAYESLSGEVRALCEDRDGNLWVGLKDGKLRVYDREHRERGYLTDQGTIARSGTPLQGTAYYLLPEADGTLWIATKGDGLVKAVPEGSRYRLTRYLHDPQDSCSLSDNNLYCLYRDSLRRLWVATFGGGLNCLVRDGQGKEVFLHSRNRLRQYPGDFCNKVRCVTGDGKGRIWIGTTQGALMAEVSDARPEDITFHHYRRIPGDTASLSNNDVHWIHPARDGRLYFATFGGGLNRLTSLDGQGRARFHAYSVADGLPSDVLLSIREDAAGRLWMAGEHGISKYIPAEDRFENYRDDAFPLPLRFSEAAALCTTGGGLMFGTSNGAVCFYPDSIRKSSYVPPIVLTRLLVANREVVPGEGSLLTQTLDDTGLLTLTHRQNNITLHYAALDYSAPAQVQYAYRLEGFDEGWNYVGHDLSATYTNLPKGEYVFRVRSTNADGVWTDNARELSIRVLPSFWQTPFAWFLYVLVLVLVVTATVYILFTIYRLKHRVSMEHQLTDMKLRFFTDISHELRTPLTLIAGPVETVLDRDDLPPDAREQLQAVSRNTGRMLRLVNQILDFRKIQNRKMKLRVQRIEATDFTRQIMAGFDTLAAERQIDYRLEAPDSPVFLYVDADKYEKILYNLLSNAFKYTPPGKSVTVFLHEDQQTVTLGVRDRGIGIADNRRKSIFVRFESLADRNLFNPQPGTGIGLSLVRELVEMHRATIRVDSKLGEGSCFSVQFRKGREHYDDTVEFLRDDGTAAISFSGPADAPPSPVPPAPAPAPCTATDAPDKELMLIVEDNAELRSFLRSLFHEDYRIAEAGDGEQGCSMARECLPDIIISDVMMPRKDGIALTRDLRADLATSHIPLILLTARTAVESQLAGLDCGADDYVTKPFSARYLKARVRNLLEQRRKLQQSFRERMKAEAPSPAPAEAPAPAPDGDAKTSHELSPNDRRFMNRLMELMEQEMDNGDLMVDDLVRNLAVSRSVFFKKLKSLTGLSPVEFIREVRINRAARLIASGGYTIAQVSYMVGINDPRYFSKCFKQQMGMTPTEYRDRRQSRTRDQAPQD